VSALSNLLPSILLSPTPSPHHYRTHHPPLRPPSLRRPPYFLYSITTGIPISMDEETVARIGASFASNLFALQRAARSSRRAGSSESASVHSLPPSESSSHLSPPPSCVEITSYDYYEPRGQRDDYFNTFVRNFKEYNPHDQTYKFSQNLTRDYITIFAGRDAIFRCKATGVAPRNLLIEMHTTHYDIPKWLEKRNQGGFSNFNFVVEQSPPSKK
jgi:hypothetical protein